MLLRIKPTKAVLVTEDDHFRRVPQIDSTSESTLKSVGELRRFPESLHVHLEELQLAQALAFLGECCYCVDQSSFTTTTCLRKTSRLFRTRYTRRFRSVKKWRLELHRRPYRIEFRWRGSICHRSNLSCQSHEHDRLTGGKHGGDLCVALLCRNYLRRQRVPLRMSHRSRVHRQWRARNTWILWRRGVPSNPSDHQELATPRTNVRLVTSSETPNMSRPDQILT